MDRSHPSKWKYTSPDALGLHVVVSPDNSPCVVTWILGLNTEVRAASLLADSWRCRSGASCVDRGLRDQPGGLPSNGGDAGGA